ncbi:MAG: DUF447 family protein [Synergistales bacterium]|nr:DUF447 family protein [Synergistales bacterium]
MGVYRGTAMIIETILTTTTADGRAHVAPMGVEDRSPGELLVRPFVAGHTWANLQRCGYAVVNIVDRVLPFVQSALGDPALPSFPAVAIPSSVLDAACSWQEVELVERGTRGERGWARLRVVHQGRRREPQAPNRARNALLEATIAATRVHIHGEEPFRTELARAAELVERTGGAEEREALALLQRWGDGYPVDGMPVVGGRAPERERPRRVRVVSHSRLHLGFLDLNGGLGRRFGSIGVALERPVMELTATAATELKGEGDDRERMLGYAEGYYKATGIPEGERALLELTSALPAHVGLGSGTQLALTVGRALDLLHGGAHSIRELAVMMGRGKRSGAGIALFDRGGFVVDGGHRLQGTTAVPPLLWRRPLPSSWHFVVAIPGVQCGISGEAEKGAFRGLPDPPPETAAPICRHTLMGLMPAVEEGDIEAFGRSLTTIQKLVGDCFAPAQEGRYACPLSRALIDQLRALGAFGVGQSSWGPTVYGLVEGADAAEAIRRRLEERSERRDVVTVFTSPAATGGARWSVER